MFRRDADAEVPHGDFRGVARFSQRDFDGRTAAVLKRVRDEIDDGLLDEAAVAFDFRGIVRGDFQRRSRRFRARQTEVHRVFHGGVEAERKHFLFAGNLLLLDRGEAEHVLHERVEALRLLGENAEEFFAKRGIVERAGLERVYGAENAGQRRFDFVRNVGDEIAAEGFEAAQIRQVRDREQQAARAVV